MSTVKFRLKPNSSKKEEKIYLRYRKKGAYDFEAPVGFAVDPKYWNDQEQKVKVVKAVPNAKTINKTLTNLTKYFNDYTDSNTEKGYTPTTKGVRAHWDSYFKPVSRSSKTTLKDYLEDISFTLKDRPETFLNSKQKTYAKGTIKGIRTSISYFLQFYNEWGKYDFEDIDRDWYDEFCNFCDLKKLAYNYKGKHIKNLKTLLNRAVDKELTNNTKFRKFKVHKEDADNVYLTMDELYKLWQMDLSKEATDTKERVRDIFLIGAFTGLRISDYNKGLSKDNVKIVEGVECISIIPRKTSKTRKKVVIPIHPVVRAILDKYKGHPPPTVADKTINQEIKNLCQDVGIDEVIFTAQTKGTLTVEEKKMKYELVSSHTARRSFATNGYLAGIPSLDLMAITGHTTEVNFLKYIKVTPEEVAIKLSKNPFFQGQLRVV